MNKTMRWQYVFLLCSFLFVSPVLASGPQPPTELNMKLGAVDISRFPEVTVPVTVRDANGVPVPELSVDAFTMREDMAAQAVTVVDLVPSVNPEIPVSLVLVMDVSGSMAGQPLADAKDAARALVSQLGAQDHVGILAFADTVDLDAIDPRREQPPTPDHAVVGDLIDSLTAEGGTPLYDALYKAVLWTQKASLGHRAVILLTDGVDEGPGSRVAGDDTPINEATRANIPIFTIGLGGEIDSGYLERVARTTGGFYQETPDSEDLAGLFVKVPDALKQQYLVSYASDLPSDGQTHQLQVTVRVGDRRATAEAQFGPLPNAPTPTPEPAVTDTAIPTMNPTDVPITEIPAATAGPVTEEAETEPSSGIAAGNIVAGIAAIVVLGAILVVVLRRRSTGAVKGQTAAQEYCLSCGRALAPGEACPDCGPDAKRFKKPQL